MSSCACDSHLLPQLRSSTSNNSWNWYTLVYEPNFSLEINHWLMNTRLTWFHYRPHTGFSSSVLPFVRLQSQWGQCELVLQMCDFSSCSLFTLCLPSLYSLFTFVYSRSWALWTLSFHMFLIFYHMSITFSHVTYSYHMHTIFHMLNVIICLPFITCYFIYLDYKIPAVIRRT